MGSLKRNILGIHGRIGDMIFYERNDRTYVRSRSNFSGKKLPAACRPAVNMFTQASLFYQFLPEELKVPWKIAAKGQCFNCRNLFIRINFHAFATKGSRPYPEHLQFSYGNLSLPLGLYTERTEIPNEWKLGWDADTLLPYTSPSDKLYVVEIHTEHPLEVYIVRKIKAVRGDGCCTFKVRYSLGEETHLYCFFGNSKNTAFSCCAYFRINN